MDKYTAGIGEIQTHFGTKRIIKIDTSEKKSL